VQFVKNALGTYVPFNRLMLEVHVIFKNQFARKTADRGLRAFGMLRKLDP
jgi:hypothetical protein